MAEASLPGTPAAAWAPGADEGGPKDAGSSKVPQPILRQAVSGVSVVSSSGRRKTDGVIEFDDAERIKERVKAVKSSRKSYKVENLYHQTGLAQQIARDSRFENLTLAIISINAVWIAVDTDWNLADTLLDADIVFIVADVLFFAYFSVELFIRFCAFRSKLHCLKDPWFAFDSVLVALYAVDPFIIAAIAAATDGGGISGGSLPRLLRLLRLSRLVRMLRALPEMMIMIKAMFIASASVSYTLGLLIVVTYVFAIALTQIAKGYDFGEDFLSGVAHSMYTLILYCTFLDDLSVFADAVREESTVCLIICTVFIVLASMTIMNMLIGVLCEVISAVAAEEREEIMVETVHEKFKHIVLQLDTDKGGTISWAEFQQIITMQDALKAFESVKVDPEGVIDFAQDLFWNEAGMPKELAMHQFMEMVLDLRGGKMVTMKDLMRASKNLKIKFAGVGAELEALEEKVDKLVTMITKQ